MNGEPRKIVLERMILHMHEFDTALSILEGKMPWTVFYVPFSVLEEYDTNGRLNVKAIVDGHEFTATLLPNRNGHYLVFNREMQSACGKGLGDTVHVILEKDNEPRIVDIPHDVKSSLAASGVLRSLENLPQYIQREEIRRIEDAKKSATREKRILALVSKLKERDS